MPDAGAGGQDKNHHPTHHGGQASPIACPF
jgi:hypothetical protein